MGQFKPGQQKPAGSGRKRGAPNKRTLDLESTLARHGLDVVGKIAEILPSLPAEKQADVLIDMMSYLFPKRRAVEQTVEVQASGPESNFSEMSKKDYYRELARLERISGKLSRDQTVAAAHNTVAEDYERQAMNCT